MKEILRDTRRTLIAITPVTDDVHRRKKEGYSISDCERILDCVEQTSVGKAFLYGCFRCGCNVRILCELLNEMQCALGFTLNPPLSFKPLDTLIQTKYGGLHRFWEKRQTALPDNSNTSSVQMLSIIQEYVKKKDPIAFVTRDNRARAVVAALLRTQDMSPIRLVRIVNSLFDVQIGDTYIKLKIERGLHKRAGVEARIVRNSLADDFVSGSIVAYGNTPLSDIDIASGAQIAHSAIEASYAATEHVRTFRSEIFKNKKELAIAIGLLSYRGGTEVSAYAVADIMTHRLKSPVSQNIFLEIASSLDVCRTFVDSAEYARYLELGRAAAPYISFLYSDIQKSHGMEKDAWRDERRSITERYLSPLFIESIDAIIRNKRTPCITPTPFNSSRQGENARRRYPISGKMIELKPPYSHGDKAAYRERMKEYAVLKKQFDAEIETILSGVRTPLSDALLSPSEGRVYRIVLREYAPEFNRSGLYKGAFFYDITHVGKRFGNIWKHTEHIRPRTA